MIFRSEKLENSKPTSNEGNDCSKKRNITMLKKLRKFHFKEITCVFLFTFNISLVFAEKV